MQPYGYQDREPIAIIGISSIFPGAADTLTFWQNILDAKDLISEVPGHYWLTQDYYDPDPQKKGKTYARRGGFIPPVYFDPDEFRLPPNTLSSTDTVQLLSLICAGRLIKNLACVQSGQVDKKRISVILGGAPATEMMVQMMGHIQHPNLRKAMRETHLSEDVIDDVLERLSRTYSEWTENSFPGSLGNITAGRIANRLDLGGKNCIVDAACASSLAAVSAAVQDLQLGHSDLAVTGGADAHNDAFMFICFSKTPALSPSGDCRPFSDHADGTLLGEGVGLLALRRLSDAIKARDPIYAVIRGVGASSDGLGKSIYAPLAQGQALAIQRAYDMSGISPADVQLIEAHGTATKANDQAEFQGLCQVFGNTDSGRRQSCALGSVKSQIGHTKSAAGAASMIKAALALHHNILPPTIKVDQPNSQLDFKNSPFYLNTETRPWIHPPGSPRRAGISAFGFGGTNFHMVMEEYQGDNPTAVYFRTSPVHLVVFSSSSHFDLIQKMCDLKDRPDSEKSMAAVARKTQAEFDPLQAFRLSIITDGFTGMISLLQKALNKISESPDVDFSLAGKLYYRNSSKQGKTAFLFPGQGSQYLNMGRDLTMAFDTVRSTWDRISGFEHTDIKNLHTRVFPIPVFDAKALNRQQALLADTRNAQPCIGAASLSMLHLLNELGIRPDCTGGHSYGEISALFCAGVISSETDMMAISLKRGELMADQRKDREPSGMTAVMAPLEQIRQCLAGSSLVMANENSPDQAVISGSIKDLEEIEKILGQTGMRHKRLPVSMGFHSGFVSPASEKFHGALGLYEFKPPRIPVYANTTGKPYPEKEEDIRQLLSCQLSRPVRFIDQIEQMYQDGVRVFIEVGPGSVLTGLVQKCLPGKEITAVAIDQKGQNGVTGLWQLLGVLSAEGIPVCFEPLWQGVVEGRDQEQKIGSSIAVEIDGSNYDRPYPPKDGVLPGPVKSSRPGSFAADRLPSNQAEKKASLETKTREPEISQNTRPVKLGLDEFRQVLLDIVSEKTGYPQDILDFETDLESGFGIDSIKKVEILGAFQDRFPDLDLGDAQGLFLLKSLQDIMDHIKSLDLDFSRIQGNAPQKNSLPQRKKNIRRQPVGLVPAPGMGKIQPGLSDPDMLYIMGDNKGVAPILCQLLNAVEIAAKVVDQPPMDANGILFLKGINLLSDGDAVCQAIALNRSAFETARRSAPAMRQKGGVFITVQDTNGDFNFSGRAGNRSWSGGIAALAKAVAKEWPKTHVKAIDIQCKNRSSEDIARAIFNELLTGGPGLEIGLTANGERFTVEMQQPEWVQESPALPVGTVVLVSGGARGITAHCIQALAARSRLRIAILGRNHQPPAFDELASKGAEVIYFQADIRNKNQVLDAVAAVHEKWRHINVLIHGAGIIADQMIDQKDIKDFDQVFSTKVDGFLHLLDATQNDPLHHICCFSSVVARIGNIMQTDYCMANEVINKVCQTESFRRNGSCRVISINWGPWESGMVNARHEKFFEFAGFQVISVSEGSDLFVKEICDTRQNRPVEVVIHGTKEDEIDDPARDADQGPVEIAWQIQLEQTPWIKDHSPTFLIPVLPMTGELEMMCSHAASVFPGETLIRVNGLESKQWAAFESDCLSGRTLVHVRGKGMAEVELQIRAPGESSPVYTMVARAELIFGKVYPQPDDELIPDIENPKPVPDPYGSGALFHGTSLQLMTSLEQGKNGCRSVVSCESRGVPHGCVHPGMLDAVLHGVPWYPEIVNTMMAFPIGLDKLFIYEKFPEHGSVSVEARTLHSHQRYFPVTRIWILDGKRQLARFDLTLMLLPKGPFAKIPGKSWKRFLACQGHVSGIGLLTGHEDVRIMKLDDVKTMDWLPGTLSKVYQVPEQENGFFEKIAMKTHAGSCLFLHPSRICIDTSTGRCMNLPLNDFFLTSEQKENRIITRATGPGRLDVSNMTAFWEQRTGISRNILSDMILSFFLKFVRRLILEDPDQYTSVKKGPALYLGNHQTGIESLLLAFVLGYLTRSPFYGLTNQEQGHGMLSVLKHLADNFLSIKLPVHMLVFDQQKRESLYDHLREYRIRARESNACLYLAAEGRRALQAGQSISQVSSVFIDFAIENRIPVVPVRFTGGLPRNSVGNLFDFPYGYGSQDYYIGKAIMPEILKELDYGKRPRYIVDRINNLGPEQDEEIPFGPDVPFQEAIAVQMETSGISELSAMIVESLNLLDDPCDETLALKKRIRTKDLDGLDDTSALFAIMTLLTMG